jgi:hypothetical protein
VIAALYVQRDGCYYGLPDVDPWDEARDARQYAGPWPVVAHPPCERWCMPLAKVNETRYGHRVGDDGGCFEAALAAVRAHGGVLEHPAASAAWDAFCLTRPARAGWSRALCEGWVCQVSQGAYGHKAVKRTWLYLVGDPPSLDWSEPEPLALTSWLQRTASDLPRLSKREASATPPAFRDLLLGMARSAGRVAA